MKIFGFYFEKGVTFVLLPLIVALTIFFWVDIDEIIHVIGLTGSVFIGGFIHLILLMTFFTLFKYDQDMKKSKNSK